MCFVVLVLGVTAAGCGSEDRPTSGATVEPSGAATKARGENIETGGENAETGVPQHGATRTRDDQDAGGVRSGTGRGDEARGLPSGGPATLERMARHCPASLAPTCEALIKAAVKPRDGSHEALETGDCTKILTKAECEAIDAARKQAAEAPDSTLMSGAEFKQCLENPTPRCEKLLGPILARQREFEESQESGG